VGAPVLIPGVAVEGLDVPRVLRARRRK